MTVSLTKGTGNGNESKTGCHLPPKACQNSSYHLL